MASILGVGRRVEFGGKTTCILRFEGEQSQGAFI
jgi:hypothetical protein